MIPPDTPGNMFANLAYFVSAAIWEWHTWTFQMVRESPRHATNVDVNGLSAMCSANFWLTQPTNRGVMPNATVGSLYSKTWDSCHYSKSPRNAICEGSGIGGPIYTGVAIGGINHEGLYCCRF